MTHLGGLDIFGGIVFVVVIILIIRPVTVKLPLWAAYHLRRLLISLHLTDPPKPTTPPEAIELEDFDKTAAAAKQKNSGLRNKPFRITIGLSSAPLLAVLLLLVTTAIGGNEIAKGIAGDAGVRPYDVLVLFISLAYIATALDATGGLRYLAFLVALKAGKSGGRLYLSLYAFFFLAGGIIGNDPIVLSGTPFLAYLTRVSGITPPTAWIFAQFLAANVSSAILVSSNPTNVLISGAFELNYLEGFTKYTIVPSVAGAVLVYPLLFYGFRSSRVARFIDRSTGSISEDGDATHLIPKNFEAPDVDARSALVDPRGAVFHTTLLLTTLATLVGTSFVPGGVGVWMVTAPAAIVGIIRDVLHDMHANRKGSKTFDSRDSTEPTTLPSIWRRVKAVLPSTAGTLSRLPWPLLPFAVGMFILVRSLSRFGYIEIFATWAARACSSPASAVFFVGGIVAFGLCPLCGTNIGATILAVEVLASPSFQQAPHVLADPRILRGAIYAVSIASNTGALVTLPSSLAGLLWSRILGQKGIRISQTGFILINAIPVIVVTFSALGIVLLEVLYWN